MILDFNNFIINESSLKTAKKELRGVLKRKERKRMKELLKKHIVVFKFKKKNGDIRKAIGTLIPSYLPKLRGGAPRPEHQMVYFDIDKGEWRSFRSYSFIEILNIEDGSGLSAVSTSLKHTSSKPATKSKYVEDEDEEKKIKADENEGGGSEKSIDKHPEKDEHNEKEDVQKKEVFNKDEHNEDTEHKKEEKKHSEKDEDENEKDDEKEKPKKDEDEKDEDE